MLPSMSDVTKSLSAIGRNDPTAAGELLLLVYDGPRRMAEAPPACQAPGQTTPVDRLSARGVTTHKAR
jgi:hypothetical protein